MNKKVKFPTQAAAILDFYKNMRPDFKLGKGIGIMNPWLDPVAADLATTFYKKFYSDPKPRLYLFGINPGRHGGGITGIPFTDPGLLQEKCGIPNDLKRKAELSAQFVYAVIDAYGGVKDFYGDIYITALSPLGYTRDDLNLNYYDDKALLKDIEPFMIDWIRIQLATIPTGSICCCLGEGENYKQFKRLNDKHQFFREIVPLPHPRWVMQYRRKKLGEYVELYVQKLKASARAIAASATRDGD